MCRIKPDRNYIVLFKNAARKTFCARTEESACEYRRRRQHAYRTVALRIRRGVARTGKSWQLSTIQKWREGTRKDRETEEVRGDKGWGLEIRHARADTRVFSPCRNFRGLSCWLFVFFFLILSRSCLHFSHSIQYSYTWDSIWIWDATIENWNASIFLYAEKRIK